MTKSEIIEAIFNDIPVCSRVRQIPRLTVAAVDEHEEMGFKMYGDLAGMGEVICPVPATARVKDE